MARNEESYLDRDPERGLLGHYHHVKTKLPGGSASITPIPDDGTKLQPVIKRAQSRAQPLTVRERQIRLALAGYNGGLGRVLDAKTIPEIRETRNYTLRNMVHHATDVATDLTAEVVGLYPRQADWRFDPETLASFKSDLISDIRSGSMTAVQISRIAAAMHADGNPAAAKQLLGLLTEALGETGHGRKQIEAWYRKVGVPAHVIRAVMNRHESPEATRK